MKAIGLCTFITAFVLSLAAYATDEPDAGLVASGADAVCCDACTKAAAAKESNEPPAATLTDLEEIESLRDQFNADKGHPRGIALLSPVCPGCIASANLIQEQILDAYPESDLRLYVVWLPMVPGDARERWSDARLNDERAVHYWNESRSIGKWFAQNITACEPLGPIAWDVIYLFEPDAEWSEQAPETVFCPSPAYAHPDELVGAAHEFLGTPDSGD